jgi:DNA-binding NarL/FixJ family response regulator
VVSVQTTTAQDTRTAIQRKLNVNDCTQAVIYAMRHGWIRVGEN